MLNGTDEQFMPLQMEGHQLHVIGYDGIANPALRPTDVAELAPGNRCEFLVKCGDPGTYAFKQLPVIGEQFENNSGMTLMNLTVSGEPVSMQLPTSLPAGMRPLAGANAAGNTVMFETIFPYPDLLTGVGFTINGLLYDETRIDHNSRLDTVEEWEVMAHPDEGHPLHIHVNAFQVTQIGDEIVDPPVYKDTVWVPKGKTVKILVPFERFTGKSVYHCHILIHEDTGMMQNFIISR
jgi:FtsP/CotA-like multicopper oxidase with cupredoxin domain